MSGSNMQCEEYAEHVYMKCRVPPWFVTVPISVPWSTKISRYWTNWHWYTWVLRSLAGWLCFSAHGGGEEGAENSSV